MDTVDILKICARRWYVMLPILLGAAGVSYQLEQAQETTFTAATSYGLFQPELGVGAEAEAERNFLGPDGSGLVGAALEAQLNSRETQEQLGSDATRGWGPGEVENASSYSVRIPLYETTYEVRAWGADEQAVRDVVNRVIQAAPGIADELQDRAGAPRSGRYQPFVLAPTQVEALPATSGMKLVVAVMGVGVLMGAAWSVVADRVLRHAGRRRAARIAGDATEPRPAQVQSQATEPDTPQPEPPVVDEQEPAKTEPRPRPGLKPVVTPAGGPPRKPRGTGPPESRGTPNGQRRPQGKVAADAIRQGAQQRRRTGGK